MATHGLALKQRRYSILLVSFSYPPVLGGSEIEAQRVAKELNDRGHLVEVVCAGGAPMPKSKYWQDPAGIPVHIFAHSHHRWRHHEFAIRAAHFLWSVRRRVDVVYFLMQGIHLATCVPLAQLLGLPFVMKFSGSGAISSLKQTRLGRLELAWLKLYAKKIMVLNDGMIAEAIDAGFRQEQILWMPNPVDSRYFAPISKEQRRVFRSDLGIAADEYVIVYTGRLAAEKQLPTLINSLEYVASEGVQVTLVLVGDGPERGALEHLARGVDPGVTVRFEGKVEQHALRKWLQVADVFALVSSLEGFSCSLIEAMSVGLPSVVSRIPGNCQLIIDGSNGFVTEVLDERELAQAFLRLSARPELRRQLGAAARRLVTENYTPESVATRYEDMFANVAPDPEIAFSQFQ